MSEPWWAALAGLVFIGVTIWWLTRDNRVPDFDEGMHLFDAIVVRNQLASGQLTAPFTSFNNYPPLVHLVGALGFLIAGFHEAAAILAQDFVFVPALVAGCYTAGSVAYGRRAGLLAALFALGTPMIVSEMREYYVDPGEAAMVAACVGAILASRRFERVGLAALAGVLCALGSLTKETFVLFVGGLVLVVVLRGGWRNWRGLLVFAILGGGLGLPWYINHVGQLNVLTQGATSAVAVASGNATAGAGITPPRYSSANVGWYLWDMLNHQLLVPLTLFFLVGTGVALTRFARHRDPDDLTPELVIGGLVGYLGVSYITLKDPRYSLPALVYVAVLGSGWIATAPARARRWLTGAFGVVVAANFIAVSFGFGPTLSITFPGAPNPSVAGARVVTFYSPNGWLRGGPARDGDLLGLIRELKRLHFRYMAIDGGSANIPDFNQNGLGVLSIEAGLPEWSGALSGLGPNDAFLLRHFAVAGDPPPCQRLADGSGVYVEVGNPLAAPFIGYEFVCPGRRPLYYHRTAPLPESLTHVIAGPLRTTLLKLFRAMKEDGVRSAEFDPSMDTQYADNPGLQALANMEGLSVPLANDPSGLAPKQAYMLLHAPVPGDAPPCVRTPGGDGIYMILGGDAAVPFDDYRYYCPLRTPHFYVHPG